MCPQPFICEAHRHIIDQWNVRSVQIAHAPKTDNCTRIFFLVSGLAFCRIVIFIDRLGFLPHARGTTTTSQPAVRCFSLFIVLLFQPQPHSSHMRWCTLEANAFRLFLLTVFFAVAVCAHRVRNYDKTMRRNFGRESIRRAKNTGIKCNKLIGIMMRWEKRRKKYDGTQVSFRHTHRRKSMLRSREAGFFFLLFFQAFDQFCAKFSKEKK